MDERRLDVIESFARARLQEHEGDVTASLLLELATAARQALPLAPAGRDLQELQSAGVLWYVNRVAFHPRGFALALHRDARSGRVAGWSLRGDGAEVWSFDGDEDEYFDAIEAEFARLRLLAAHRAAPPPRPGWQRRLLTRWARRG